MKDDFLYQLRKPPPEDFARRLKARLDRQGIASTPRKRSLNLYALIALMLGGTAFAFVSPNVRNAAFAWFKELRAEQPSEPPVQQAHVPKAAPAHPHVPAVPKPPLQTSWKWGGDASSTSASATTVPTRDRIALINAWPNSAYTSFIDRVSQIGAFDVPSMKYSPPEGAYGLFCSGVGIRYPDMLLAEDRITPPQLDLCIHNGAKALVEIKMGYEAIVLAAHTSSASTWTLSPRDVFLALSQKIPDPMGANRYVANPYTTWRQVNPSLPEVRIAVIGPALGSTLHQVFIRVVLLPGCAAAVANLSATASEAGRPALVCYPLRKDGAYVEGGGDDHAVLRRLADDPTALGVFSYNFQPSITGKFTPLPIGGVYANNKTLARNQYSFARPFYLYIKRAHFDFVPDLARLTKAYGTHDITPQGIVPLTEADRARSRADALNLTNLQTSKLTGR